MGKSNNNGCFISLAGFMGIVIFMFWGASILGEKLNLQNGSGYEQSKITSIYNKYAFIRLDDTDRLLVSREWYELIHKECQLYTDGEKEYLNLGVMFNSEVYLGKHYFQISDTLSSHYLVGDKFLLRNNIEIILNNGSIECLYDKPYDGMIESEEYDYDISKVVNVYISDFLISLNKYEKR